MKDGERQRKIRLPSHGTVVAYLALFVALGGSAYAIKLKRNSVGPKQIKPGAVRTSEVANDRLTGNDIVERSLVSVCPAGTTKLGRLCARAGVAGNNEWTPALNSCAALRLRLPTVSEGVTLGKRYNVPGVAPLEYFWTDDYYHDEGDPVDENSVGVVSEEGTTFTAYTASGNRIVCVTEPQ